MGSDVLKRPAPGRGLRIAFEWWWLVWVAAALCTFLCGVALGIVSSGGAGGGGGWFSQFLAPAFGGRSHVTVLAVGVDTSQGRGLADTIIVAMVRPQTGEISALSIPRDSRVEIPGVGVRRINSAHSFGGLPLTIEAVELLLGMPIDYHIEIDVPGIVKLVDALGGADIDVEKRMRYRDRSQNLNIDLQPGLQHLNGEQAMGYVRFRHDATGDIGRIARQQTFLRTVIRELLGAGNISRLPKLAQAFVETVETNLTVREVLALKKLVEQTGADGVRTETLPGEPRTIGGQSMIELDPDEVRKTVDRVLWGRGLSVEVLNGTDVNGLAGRVASQLEEAGWDITEIGNASEETERTVIVDHRGRTRRAERVAAWLGQGVISASPDGENPADVTVIVGRDLMDGAR